MEKFSYNSYDSADSSPRSRDFEFENPPPWDDQQQSQQNYKLKFMCSYGGKIQPRPHDNQLSYIGGETKILSVERNINFAAVIAKLSALINDANVSFKYQLPGEELDALISVTNDDDLDHLKHEYDRLYRGSAKPARMRLFLFPISSSGGYRSDTVTKSEPDRFLDALSSGQTVQTAGNGVPIVSKDVDFSYRLEKEIAPPPIKAREFVPEVMEPLPQPPTLTPQVEFNGRSDDRYIGSDHGVVSLQRQLQDLQMLQSREQEQQQQQDGRYRRIPDESGGYYTPQTLIAGQHPIPAACWPDKQRAGGIFPSTMATPEQQMYVIHGAPHGTVYHPQPPPAVMKQVNDQTGQSYYNVQRVAADIYREQQLYNMAHPPPPPPIAITQGPPFSAAAPASIAQQFPPGVVRPISANNGVMNPGYAPVIYENGVGRQVFYGGRGRGIGGTDTLPGSN